MAIWKRLTKVDGDTIYVNLDAVMHMQRHKQQHTTTLVFPVRENEIWVKESLEEICALPIAMSWTGGPPERGG